MGGTQFRSSLIRQMGFQVASVGAPCLPAGRFPRSPACCVLQLRRNVFPSPGCGAFLSCGKMCSPVADVVCSSVAAQCAPQSLMWYSPRLQVGCVRQRVEVFFSSCIAFIRGLIFKLLSGACVMRTAGRVNSD